MYLLHQARFFSISLFVPFENPVRYIYLMLPSVVEGGPTVAQHCVNGSCLLGSEHLNLR